MKYTLTVLLLTITLWPSLTSAEVITLHGIIHDCHTQKIVDSVHIQVMNRSDSSIAKTLSKSSGRWSIQLTTTAIDESDSLSALPMMIADNFPNPFRQSTTIPFHLSRRTPLVVTVYNILGETLDRRSLDLGSGSYQIGWQSLGAPSVLLVNFTCETQSRTIKMLQLDAGSGGLCNPVSIGDHGTVAGHLNRSTGSSLLSTDLVIRFKRFDYLEDSILISLPATDTIKTLMESIHHHAFFIDLHNDILERTYGVDYDWGIRHTTKYHTDIPRLQEGGVDAQFFVLWVDPDFTESYFDIAQGFINTFHHQLGRYPSLIGQARLESEITELNAGGKIAAILAAEGGHILEDDPDHLIELYRQGVRYLTITWNNSTDWAISAQDSRSETQGLSEFGRQIIRTMDSLGIIIDISHTGIQTIRDILEETRNPIVATHSGAYSVRPHYRNLKDDQIVAIAEKGGLIGVVFYPSFLTATGKAKIDDVIRHIDYIVNLVGIDYVAIGSDFDGMESTPSGLENVSKFPNLTKELLRHGYTPADVQKILGQNMLRVWHDVVEHPL
ncbi:MAG: dipeptidase [Candidatus Delongbacteria bacterium]|nr:dipeptidase [Candidatus Delongbacteria bacterium]